MFELGLVKRRKRRIIAAIIAGTSSLGVGTMSIVAFIGRYTGTFTVSVNNGEISMSLDTTQKFTNPQSVLRIHSLVPYVETDYKAILRRGDAELDSETTPYLLGGNPNSTNPKTLSFFKYTFYLKNTGAQMVTYDITFRIVESTAAPDGRFLDDTLRVAIYENDVDTNQDPEKDKAAIPHKKTVYAKEMPATDTPNIQKDGTATRREFVSLHTRGATETDENPLATPFEGTDVIASYTRSGFKVNDMKRYTLVAWLDGEDPDSDEDKQAPEGASIRLGVEINAHENQLS